MNDLATLFESCWTEEVEKRRQQSPSFAVEDYTATGRAAAAYGGCVIEGCERKHNARGLCTTHYERWRLHGDPHRAGRSVWDRLREKIAHPPRNGCWEWLGGTDGKYGVFRYEGRLQKAHRVTYQVLVGPIPDGLDLDHLCRNTYCVNPEHLEPVTRSENLRRGAAARKAGL